MNWSTHHLNVYDDNDVTARPEGITRRADGSD
ncbi:hypothetical protein SAMN05444279_12013 [Ruegeria intermedia]|uniref:Uncharacterized protein n=1 Tax=Ruegeria intermedia TaxID=996115 RepID=A0A1M4ZIV0_9RHOB|nr:hypothetical protein SAMN05444279_12013 [Ruegeria intermedia]